MRSESTEPNELVQLMHQLLDSEVLNDSQRLLLWLRLWRGMTFKSIALHLDLSPVQVRRDWYALEVVLDDYGKRTSAAWSSLLPQSNEPLDER
jgi:hypothetical protein